MKPTEQTLLEQLRITESDIQRRKDLLGFTEQDEDLLRDQRSRIDAELDAIVEEFYRGQLEIPEVALLIGDADTLANLHQTQRKYILSLFSGQYGLEYVNNRLRIGQIHKRIGVGPCLYLAAVQSLKELLFRHLGGQLMTPGRRRAMRRALERLLVFDNTLVFEMYISAVLNEVEDAQRKAESYARDLEQTIRDRTQELELLSMTDARTGLLNARNLEPFLTRTVRAAERRAEPVTVLFFDIDDFKQINDTAGHQQGDEILRTIGNTVSRVSRAVDGCFRYGGDEFCIVLPDCTETQACDEYLVRLRDILDGVLPGIRISVGLVQTGPEEYHDPIEMIGLADRRMYEAKAAAKALADPEGGAADPARDNLAKEGRG